MTGPLFKTLTVAALAVSALLAGCTAPPEDGSSSAAAFSDDETHAADTDRCLEVELVNFLFEASVSAETGSAETRTITPQPGRILQVSEPKTKPHAAMDASVSIGCYGSAPPPWSEAQGSAWSELPEDCKISFSLDKDRCDCDLNGCKRAR